MALENADWLLGTIEGHVYMVVAYTAVMIVQGYAYMKIAERLHGSLGVTAQPGAHDGLEVAPHEP